MGEASKPRSGWRRIGCASFLVMACGEDGFEPTYECVSREEVRVDDGLSRNIVLLNACAERYFDWADRLAGVERETEVYGVLEEARLRELDDVPIWNAVSSSLTVATNGLDDLGRERAFIEAAERLEEPEATCRRARAAFANVLAENETLCLAFMDWEEGHTRSWDAYGMVRTRYQETCGSLCPGLFVAEGHHLVPRPTGIRYREQCS